ncbi:MAG: hypothetical protein JST00_29770 [Deltaproteobacteria bacterium]|nr:hypothetical protein [Deltaproteobacteria bacterium]
MNGSHARIGSNLVTCLAPGVRVADIADACRSAALGFAWGAPAWTKRDLATWLVGPYARATACSSTRDGAAGDLRAHAARTVDEDALARLLSRAHTRVIEWLRGAWTWRHDARAARSIVADGLVAGVIDEASGIGYAPVDRSGMTLVRRVESLFLADYLTRPADYAAFAVCSECDGATFDGGIYHVDCIDCSSAVLRRRDVLQEGNAIPAPWNAVAI